MQIKNSWLLELNDGINSGIGEISVIEGLSPDFISIESFELKLSEICAEIESGLDNMSSLENYPSIKFGFETAILDLQNGGKGIIFNNDFAKGEKKIPINGLIWMGDEQFLYEQVEQKLAEGFSTIKMKIGAIDFEQEIKILAAIRSKYSANQITLRVDANGAFTLQQARKVLDRLADLEIHSIEQPIEAGNWLEMKELCATTPIPIALDEELIGITKIQEKINLLDTIKPQYIILKPSLHGGISGTKDWIDLAESKNIPWWITSALESNIGLNAICQLTAEYENNLPQGLGTGSLYTNNIESDLIVENGFIYKSKKE
jgi:o-succinylbenzoate synthase